jgi:predicted transcriptional regulator
MAKADEDDTSAGTVFAVPDEHRVAVLEGLDQARRGKFATDEEIAALWEKCGL